MSLSQSSSLSDDSLTSSSLSSLSLSEDDETKPSKWQHWKRWTGPETIKDKIIEPRTGKKIKLLPCDSNDNIDISFEAYALSETLLNMSNDVDMSNGNDICIPLVEINIATTKKIVEYLEYLYDNPKDSDWDINTKQEFSVWEQSFRELDYQMLDDLCMASNYLDIKPLLKLCCNRIAMMLEGIKPIDMGQVGHDSFGTDNDIPAEEYNKIVEENEKYFVNK
jgi:S-phase kinase-associated protein 1